MTKFKAGTTYSTKSICDSNCIFTFKVVKRTAKTVWIESDMDGIKSKRVSIYHDGSEMIYPLGKYSMAPILTAKDNK